MNTKTNTGTGEPRLAASASWAVLVASFGLSAATWIAMARLAGFGAKLDLPLISVTADLAWLMPVAVDGYVVVALVLWMAPVPPKVAAFARINTYAAAGIGVAAQSAYHALAVWSAQPAGDKEVWRAVLAAVVGALPPAVAGLAVHMRALLRRESHTTPTNESVTPSAPAGPIKAPAPPSLAPVPPVEPVEQVAPAVDEPTPVALARVEATPAPVAAAPAEPTPAPAPVPPVEPVRSVPLAPVSPSAFVRRNGVPLAGEVTR